RRRAGEQVSCAEPVSWLRLERRQLGEVTGEESALIERHLAGCADCAAAASSLQSWNGRMPALPAVAPRRRPWSWGLFMVPAAPGPPRAHPPAAPLTLAVPHARSGARAARSRRERHSTAARNRQKIQPFGPIAQLVELRTSNP